MVCKKCGRQLPDGALFCKYCGARTENDTSDDKKEYKPRQNKRKKKKGTSLVIILAAVCIIALGILAGLLIWRSNTADDANNPPDDQDQTQQEEVLTASISPRDPEMEADEELRLTSAIDQDIGERTVSSTEWASDNEDVATVKDALVHAVSAGSATITVTYTLSDDTQITGQVTVTVKEPEAYTISVTPAQVALEAGESADLIAQLEQELKGVRVESTDWASSDEKVATVEDGRVTAVRAGEAEITVKITLSDGQEITAVVPVSVTGGEEEAPEETTTPSSNNSDESNSGNRDDNNSGSGENNNDSNNGNDSNSGNNSNSGNDSGNDNSGNNSGAGTTPDPTPDTKPDTSTSQSGDYVLPTNTTLISYDTLRAMSNSQLRLARNEIYARHGRKFKDAELQNYFNSKSWYHGTIEPDAFDPSVLSDIEEENLQRILAVEAER